jgi:predicted O-methyltransferase YrrM
MAARIGLEPRAALLFLDALAALGLLEKEKHRYDLSPVAKRYLLADSPEYLGHRLAAAQYDWDLWGRLPAALRSGQKQRERSVFRDDPPAARHLLLSLHREARHHAADVLKSGVLHIQGRRHMLDLGGGAGTYAVAFCRAHPQLHATLVDRPIAAALARDLVASAGLEDRITVLEYDVDERELPSVYDFIWMSNVVHSRSYDANRALCERLFHRLEPGGALVIHDTVMDENRTRPASGAVFSLHMLLTNGVGRCYTFQEIFNWLDSAGFHDIRWTRQENDMSLVICRR